MRARLAPLLLLAAILSWQTASHAENAQASEQAVLLGHKGLTLYQAGKWEEALARFQHAKSVAYSPVFVLYIARCQRNLSRLREAAAHLEQMLAQGPARDAPISWDNALRDARAELEALRLRIPSLFIEPTGVVSATVDNVPVLPGEQVQLNPGDHLIRGWSVDRRLATQEVSLVEGQHVRVTLPFADINSRPVTEMIPSLPAKVADGTRPTNQFRTASWITGGVAVASALVGAVTGLMAKARIDSIREQCDGNRCPEHLERETETARLLANVSTASFGIAALNSTFCVTFWLLPSYPAQAVPRARATSQR